MSRLENQIKLLRKKFQGGQSNLIAVNVLFLFNKPTFSWLAQGKQVASMF